MGGGGRGKMVGGCSVELVVGEGRLAGSFTPWASVAATSGGAVLS